MSGPTDWILRNTCIYVYILFIFYNQPLYPTRRSRTLSFRYCENLNLSVIHRVIFKSYPSLRVVPSTTVVVLLHVDTSMAVMCHVLVVFGKLFRGSGSRCGYCRFARSVDTCRHPVMPLLSHSELLADEFAWWHSSLSESYHIA